MVACPAHRMPRMRKEDNKVPSGAGMGGNMKEVRPMEVALVEKDDIIQALQKAIRMLRDGEVTQQKESGYLECLEDLGMITKK